MNVGKGLSLRMLLGVVLGALGLLSVTLAGSTAYGSLKALAAARMTSTATAASRQLFEVLASFRSERGSSMSLLAGTAAPPAEAWQDRVLAPRRAGEDAYDAVMARLFGLRITELGQAADSIRTAHSRVADLRTRLEAAARQSREARDTAAVDAWPTAGQDYLDALAVSMDLIDSSLSHTDAIIGYDLWIKKLAWSLRVAVGSLDSRLAHAVGAKQPWTPKETLAAAQDFGQALLAWDQLSRIAAEPATPAELVAAVAAAKVNFQGPAAERQGAIMATLGDGRVADVALSELQSDNVANQALIVDVAEAAMSLMIQHAEGQATRAARAVVLNSALLALAVFLSAAGILITYRRVIHAIRAMTLAMGRLAVDDLEVAIPGGERDDEIGDMACALKVFKDSIVRRRALEAEAIRTREQAVVLGRMAARERDRAEAASKAKSKFLASMSHELRTPLNAILGYAQILQREKILDERVATGIGTILSAGRHLLALIDSVLDFSRIEAGRLELAPHVVNLPALLANTAAAMRIGAEEKGLLFEAAFAPDLPPHVEADEIHLRQVLFNLLGNAIKFTDRGHVTFRVRRMPDGNASPRVRFEVADSGVGIATEALAAIFLAFQQVGSQSHRRGGTGLGLPISRRLVELMGGELKVESTPAEGSLFWFEIALPATEAQAPVADERLIVGYEGRPRRILVVEEAALDRAVLANMLLPLGFEVTHAVTGEAALRQMAISPPDLMLIDTAMPELEELGLTGRTRAHPAWHGVPLVAVSARATEEDRAEALRRGASDFLTKPVEQRALLGAVGGLLALTWVHDAAPAEAPRLAPDFAIPAPDDLDRLRELALDGDMHAIREWGERMAAADDRFAPLATELRRLAAGYQSKAITVFVEQSLMGLAA